MIVLLSSVAASAGSQSPALAGVGSQQGSVSRGDIDTEHFLANIVYRNLGPFRAGAWVSDIAVPEGPEQAHLYTFYVATRSGGLWKTTNNGTTFEPLFDDQAVASIGAVALASSNPEIVWAGTGGADNARSTYYGDGVYKSTDGGATWQNMGLRDSHHIARIVIHPENPEIVYVAAVGHLFTPNEERGVFKTVNGGATWEKVLYLSEGVAAIDLVLNREDPDVLYAAMYEFRRYPWHFELGGPGSGIYKTTDGGGNWRLLEGGLPTGNIGRIGIDIYRADPSIVYAVVENGNMRPATEDEAAQDRERSREPSERMIGGEVYRSEDSGETWTKTNSAEDNVGGKAAYSFNQIRVAPDNDQLVLVNSVAVANSSDGGRTWNDIDWPPRNMFPKMFGDVRAMWIDPENSDRIILGTDGGVHISYDGGKTSDFLHNLPLGEVYAVGVDMEDPYNIYAGLQDHESWRGPSNSWSGEVGIEDWVTVGIQDGMYNQVDPDDSRWLYNTFQHGGHFRVDQEQHVRVSIEPEPEEGDPPYRFTWITPLHISPHNSQILYTGGQMLLQSFDRGDHWEEVSPDLTTNDPVKIAGEGNIVYCTITTISESPRRPGVIWVGTDDGRVWMTRNHGADWTEMTEQIAAVGGPAEYWVSRVFASPHASGTAYVTKTGYRRDDFRPFVFKTTDFGETWTAIHDALPDSPVNVIYQDHENPDILYLGNDQGVFVSATEGQRWLPMRGNMPTVPVHDLVVHPREDDLVVGTYGRGIWVTDVSWLQQVTPEVRTQDVHLFEIEPKAQRRMRAWGNYQLYGDRHITTPNEPFGVPIYYWLSGELEGEVEISIYDSHGMHIETLDGPTEFGVQRVIWNMRDDFDETVPPGRYQVRLSLGDLDLEQVAVISELR
jgi:photosystem II stability/assembly factor-like uncharacterized protein